MNIQIILNFEDMEQVGEWFGEQKEFEAYKLKNLLKKSFENKRRKPKESQKDKSVIDELYQVIKDIKSQEVDENEIRKPEKAI